jgi:hypothetical protein
MMVRDAKAVQNEQLSTMPTDLKPDAVRDIAGALNALLADVFALYFKTKNFHWHVSGPHFRDYHLLLDDHADQIFCNNGRYCRKGSQDRGHDAAIDWTCQPSKAAPRQ